ncbi:cytochrome P450 [Xylariaceae sp. FL1651]|nr:cytochrome P450 [Xylariaceae sp. FL1651]
MLRLTIAVALCASFLVYLGYRWALPKPLPGIPYNAEATKSLFGDGLALMKEVSQTGDVMAWFLKQNQKTGSPVSQIFLQPLGKPLIIVRDWRAARDVMLHRSREFDRSSLMITYAEGLLDRQHFVLQTGPEWKQRRRLIDDTMSPVFLHGPVSQAVYENSLNWVKLWRLKARLADGRPFRAYYDIHFAILDTVLGFSFGSRFPHSATRPQIKRLARMTQDELRGSPEAPKSASSNTLIEFPEEPIDSGLRSMLELLDTLEEVKTSPFIPLKWWLIKRTSTFQNRKRMKNECILAEVKKAVESRTQYTKSRHEEQLPSLMCCAAEAIVDREARNAQKENRSPQFLSAMVVEEIWGLIVAGSDTLSTTFAWGVKLLADHPEVQDRLRKVLYATHVRAVEEKRLPSAEEIHHAPAGYLDATIEEMLRCGGPIPIGDREALIDTTLLGYHIPKGTNVRFLHNGPGIRLPELEANKDKYSQGSEGWKVTDQTIPGWDDEDVDLFKPERWFSAPADQPKQPSSDAVDAEAARSSFNPQAGPSIPFGLGLRGCFGRRLAYIELKILLTMLIWNFELLKCPGELSGYSGRLSFVNKPRSCYVRLKALDCPAL